MVGVSRARKIDVSCSRGVGFIHFATSEAAAAAIQEVNGTVPRDAQQEIIVRLANRGGNVSQTDRTCRFFLEGRCRKGGECDFIHEQAEFNGYWTD